MPSVIDDITGMGVVAGESGAEDPFIRIKDQLLFRRAHFPGKLGKFVPPKIHADVSDACLVVASDAIGFLCLTEHPIWSSYSDIRAGFRKRDELGSKSHTTPFSEEFVFSPLKIVLEDRDNPLRAIISNRPVYPQRAKIGTLLADAPPIWAYVATGVINSVYGQALYRHHSPGRPTAKRNYSVENEALHHIPLAHRSAGRELLTTIADLVHFISVCYAVPQDRSWRGDLSVEQARNLLKLAISMALQLPERVERQLIASVSDLRLPDAPDLDGPDLFSVHPDLDSFPPIPNPLSGSVGLEWLWTPPRVKSVGQNLERLPSDSLAFYNLRTDGGDVSGWETAIVKDPRVCGGVPRIVGTRIGVHHVVSYARAYHGNLDKIKEDFPQLLIPQLEAAMDYYLGHVEEIEEIFRRDREALEFVQRTGGRV